MGADDAAASLIALDIQELREKAGREQAGISAAALMAQRHDVIRVAFIEGKQPDYILPAQPGLIRHLKENGVTVQQLGKAQPDGQAEPHLRVGIGNDLKAKGAGGGLYLRVLGDHYHTAEAFRRDGLKGQLDEGLALVLRQQLVAAEADAVSGGHDHAADVHVQYLLFLWGCGAEHAFLVVYPISAGTVNFFVRNISLFHK